MKKLKVIIPVAGSGTRLRPHTLTHPKVLLKVSGKPILGFIMDKVKTLPAEEVIFVVGNFSDQIKTYVRKHFNKVKSRFVYQEKQLGLGHAIYKAKNFIKQGDYVLILLGDTILDANLKLIVKSKRSLIGVKEVGNPSNFGIAIVANGRVKRLIEKPTRPISNLAIVGLYFIKESTILMDILENNIESGLKTKNEFQLTDGLQKLIQNGYNIEAFNIKKWFDCGNPENLLLTNQYLLKKTNIKRQIAGSVIINPVYIGKNTKIKNSIVGPYVSIGDKCNIINSIIKNSIINEHTSIEKSTLTDSIIGSNVIIKSGHKKLNIGDFSYIVNE